jgi:hypothetical protein
VLGLRRLCWLRLLHLLLLCGLLRLLELLCLLR